MTGTVTRKGPGVIVTVGILVVVVAVMFAVQRLPERMPPDPFEGNEPREVTFEVEWDGDPRPQLIEYDVGEESGQVHTHGQTSHGTGGWYWNHRTIAFQGTVAFLSSIQDTNGPVNCAIYVNEMLVGNMESEHRPGCHVEVTIP